MRLSNEGTLVVTRTVLITGSSGFVGGAVARRFRELGWNVLGVGRRALDEPGYHSHDLSDPWPAAVGLRPDLVIHAAARSSPWGTHAEFQRANVVATQRLLGYCNVWGTPPFVAISSSSVYYRPEHQFGITETTPFPATAVNTYAATKLAAEHLVRRYPGRWVILRPRAVFGPGDTVLLPRIIEAARAGRLPLLVDNGPPVVGDLIYIENLVDYIVRAATDPEVTGDFNLTNNEPVAIIPFLMDLFERLCIPPPTRRVSPRAAMWFAAAIELYYRLLRPRQEPPITRFGVHVFRYSKTFDVSKALHKLGTPSIRLDEGLNRTVAALERDGQAEHR